eukprot:15458536-Heterocapsa_arctica.AAC.1
MDRKRKREGGDIKPDKSKGGKGGGKEPYSKPWAKGSGWSAPQSTGWQAPQSSEGPNFGWPASD